MGEGAAEHTTTTAKVSTASNELSSHITDSPRIQPRPRYRWLEHPPAAFLKGNKRALLVGCNYPNTPNELHGCHNDVLAMHEVLITRFGFDPDHVEILTDKPGSPIMPTGANIKKALNGMVDRAEEGGILFFHYSGHGTLIKQPHYSSKKEEAIVPCDFNLITS